MLCPNCGREQPDNPKFCRGCGVELNSLKNEIKVVKKSVEEVIQPEGGVIVLERVPANIHLQAFTDEANRISIFYPEGWTRIKKEVVYFHGNEGEHGVVPNFIVTCEDNPQKSLDTFSQYLKNVLQKLKNYTMISEEKIVLDGIPSIKFVYTFTEKKITIKKIMICLVEGKLGWALTFTCTANSFHSYEKIFNEIAESFHLLETYRGKEAATNLYKSVIKKDIRNWGIGLLIIGTISIFLPILDAVWGVVLIVAGVIELIIQHKNFYIVNGILLILVGIMNASSAIFDGVSFWAGIGVMQCIWGINEFRKFGKYRL